MEAKLKKKVFHWVIGIILVAFLILSVLNTYFIISDTRSSLSSEATTYDYVLSHDGNSYKLKNMLTGIVNYEPTSASSAINVALANGKSVYINPGTFVLTEDIIISNKANPKIISDGATIIGNGHKIIIFGEDYTTSRNALLSGLTLVNATIRVENSFGTTISNIVFENTLVGIEFANTNKWTEYNKVENCQFINVTEGIVFRTPVGNATGSYASSIIERVSFNLKDFSVGIKVEALAEFSDSQMQDVRFWMGENGRTNQTGLLVDGSMYKTLLLGVVFESFTSEPNNIFAINLGQTCNPAPTIDGGVSFLGNMTAKVQNPNSSWILGDGSVFKIQDFPIPVGIDSKYGSAESIHVRPLTMFAFKPNVEVDGNFRADETVTVRIRIEYIDNAVSNPVIRTFTSSGSIWLTDNEMMQLLPSQSIIWSILIDAKSSSSSTETIVKISGYGTAG